MRLNSELHGIMFLISDKYICISRTCSEDLKILGRTGILIGVKIEEKKYNRVPNAVF